MISRNVPKKAGLLFVLGVCTAFFFSFGSSPFAADDDFFLRQQIDIEGRVLGALDADFSGDSLIDIVLIVAEPSGRRVLKSYIQREGSRFPPSPGQTLAISPSANVVRAIDLDNNGRAELLYIDREGLWQYRYEAGGFGDKAQVLISEPTIFTAGIENGLLTHDCLYRVSNRLVALLPIADGFSLWEYQQGSFKKTGTLSFSHLLSASERPVKLFSAHSYAQEGRFEMSLPHVVIGNADGDTRDDICLIWPDRLVFFRQNANGQFGPDGRRDFRFQETSVGNLCQSQLVDFDRDGRLDLVCSRAGGGISGAHTDITFFTAAKIDRGDHAENYRITLTDACGNLLIGDFDQGGGLEVVVPAIELGIMTTVKKMVTKKTDFHILIYPIDNLGRPTTEPQVRKKVSCQLDFENPDPTADIRLDWSGDYDGDGRPDLVVADGAGQLGFYRGTADGYLEDKADLVLDMPSPVDIRPGLLNGDKQSDLIVIHKPAGGNTRVTLLVTGRIR